MWKQLMLLLGFLSFNVVPDGDPGNGEEGTDDAGNGEGGEGEGGENGGGGADEQHGDGADDPAPGSKEANMRAMREKLNAEREARIRAEAERDAIRQQGQRQSAGQADDPPPAGETETQRFVREGNKALKTVTSKVDSATLIAVNAADEAKFYRLTDPKLIDKYADKVEKRLEEMRKNGQNAPRQAILTYLVGEDAMKVAKSPAGKKQIEQQRRAAADRVEEGRGTPGAAPRSDKTGKERMSERDARRKRLEGQSI